MEDKLWESGADGVQAEPETEGDRNFLGGSAWMCLCVREGDSERVRKGGL